MNSKHLSRLVGVMMFLGTSCAADTGSLGDPSVRAKLRELALQASAAAGVSSPRTMIAVASADHQVAEHVVSGAIVEDHVPVYVVEMTGGPFTTERTGSRPPGVSAPKGDVLTLTIDAKTFRVTDTGVSSNAPDLTQIDSNVVDLLAD
ncbi:MAG TPA: hypothetical protein VJV78_25710 [Polyangiales bacterium]|nr:hypothetical protein [Polyangiales bacterium]